MVKPDSPDKASLFASRTTPKATDTTLKVEAKKEASTGGLTVIEEPSQKSKPTEGDTTNSKEETKQEVEQDDDLDETFFQFSGGKRDVESKDDNGDDTREESSQPLKAAQNLGADSVNGGKLKSASAAS